MSKDTRGKELKKEICKQLNLKPKDLSVRIDKYSMGESFYIKVKKPVSLKAVKAIADKHEHIDRDTYSGEILSGGNTYVFVDYDNSLTTDDVPGLENALINAAKQFDLSTTKTMGDGFYHVADRAKNEFPNFTRSDVIKLSHAVFHWKQLEEIMRYANYNGMI